MLQIQHNIVRYKYSTTWCVTNTLQHPTAYEVRSSTILSHEKCYIAKTLYGMVRRKNVGCNLTFLDQKIG